MKDWFESLEPRERLVLTGGAIVLGVILLWVMLIEPLYSSAQQRTARIAELRTDLIRAEQLKAEIAALSRSGGGTSAVQGANQSLMIVLERSAREAGLQVNQSRPMDAETVRVRFETVPFDSLVQWMATLATRYGVQVDIASLDRNDSPGMVDAQLTLKRPAA